MIGPEQALDAVHALRSKQKVVRLSDVAALLKTDEETAAEVLGGLQKQKQLVYYLQTGYDLAPDVAKKSEHAAEPKKVAGDKVVEDAGIGGRAIGARTLFPVSYQTIADYSQKKAERDKRSEENRKQTRERLRELAQESFPIPERRRLRTLD